MFVAPRLAETTRCVVLSTRSSEQRLLARRLLLGYRTTSSMGWRVHIHFLACWAATASADVANVATVESTTALARPLVGSQPGFSPGADVCNGTSAELPTAECDGWQAFWDATDGTCSVLVCKVLTATAQPPLLQAPGGNCPAATYDWTRAAAPRIPQLHALGQARHLNTSLSCKRAVQALHQCCAPQPLVVTTAR
jgi:hypothetical protein